MPSRVRSAVIFPLCAFTIAAATERPIPVSYTHLDVYKRQAVYCFVFGVFDALEFVVAGETVLAHRVFDSFMGVEAVSYTHLDVYKRQGL